MKRYITIALMSVSIFGLTACLKDKNLVLDPDKSPAVIQFSTNSDAPAGSGAGYTLYARAYEIKAGTTPSQLVINYAGPDVAPNDVTVNFDLNTAAIEAYNKAANKKYIVMPSNLFTMPTSAVIKGGTRSTTIDLGFNTSLFDLSKAYILPIRISSVSSGTISGNYSTVLLSVNAKNQYDGVYSMHGKVLRAGDPVLSGDIVDGITTNLVTTGANTVGYTQYWATGGGIAGIDGTTLSVDPATNKVTVYATSNPALKNLTSYDSRYDPGKKTFYISFYWGSGPTNRAATDTLVYIGPRK